MRKSVALTLAGSDPSGGAGVQADLKTFHQFGVYGMGVVTLLTVQNTKGVRKVKVLEAGMVLAQLDAVLEDIVPGAAKTGALGNGPVIEAVARRARRFRFPLVVDPVMVSKHGALLMRPGAVSVLKKKLLPRARLVTPNLTEAEILTGLKIRDREAMERAAKKIAGYGPEAVLIKGGHLRCEASDLLYDGGRVRWFESGRIRTVHTHGTGCTYSAAITACLALKMPLAEAVRTAKGYITEAIRTAPGLGKGAGPVNHHARPLL
ncbi:MAG: bifunctional hydroxymethylpyrimidine kinase/phosphomethylpyrimidine kinase [Candidatus Omnitrophota bacterium]|jgi:hydroxymethylpyrimidine/phosphomethylpyrimidine kinase